MHRQHPSNQPGRPTVVLGYERPLNPEADILTPWRRHDGEPTRSGYPRLEVHDDRIRLLTTESQGREWYRHDGDRVRHEAGGHHPCIHVGDNAGSGIDANCFDTERVKAAVLAHGWYWEAGGVVLTPLPSRVSAAFAPTEPQVELVLKEHRAGRMNTAAWSRGWNRAWLLLGALLVTAAVIGSFHLFGPWGIAYAFGGLVVVILVPAFAHVAKTGLAVTISRSRIVVRTGSDTKTIHRSRLIGAGRVDKYGVTFKYGKGLNDNEYIPTRDRREELLARLSAFDWPLEHK